MSSYNYFFIYVFVNMKGRGRVCMWDITSLTSPTPYVGQAYETKMLHQQD